jgi:hypothetical protein
VNLVLCTCGYAASAALGTDHQIGGALFAACDSDGVFGALRGRPPRVHDLRLDHFLAEDRGGRGGTVELEFTPLLRNLAEVPAVSDTCLNGARCLHTVRQWRWDCQMATNSRERAETAAIRSSDANHYRATF